MIKSYINQYVRSEARGMPAGARELALWNDFPTLGQPAYALADF